MKKTLSTILLITTGVSSALAADLPSRKEPVVAPPPASTWTGFYAGLNAGGTWANNNSVNITTFPFTPGTNGGYWQTASQATGSIQTGNNGGFIGGGQIGYNWQARFGGYNFVTGVEADIQGIAGGNGSGSRGLFNVIPVGAAGNNLSSVTANTSLSWIGTVRGRIGYVVTPAILVYGTGGLAYGGANMKVSTFQNLQDHELQPFDMTLTSAAFGSSNISSTPVGWTAGGGVEWMFLPSWSAKAEYLYYNLGNQNTNTVTTGFGYLNSSYIGAKNLYSSTASTNFTGNIVRAGVNYHFNFASAPVVAKF